MTRKSTTDIANDKHNRGRKGSTTDITDTTDKIDDTAPLNLLARPTDLHAFALKIIPFPETFHPPSPAFIRAYPCYPWSNRIPGKTTTDSTDTTDKTYAVQARSRRFE